MKDSCDEKDPSVCSAVGGACGQACNSPDKDCCAYWNMTGNIDSHKAGCCDVWYNNKDSSHQSFCCEDDAWAQSHSDWCDTCKPGSDNYYSNQCCNKRYSANAFEVRPPNDPLVTEYAEYLNYMYDEDACKCACSQNSQSYFCKNFCCPKKPSRDSISGACCTQWEHAGVLKNSGYGDDCCEHTHDTSYCKATKYERSQCTIKMDSNYKLTLEGPCEGTKGVILDVPMRYAGTIDSTNSHSYDHLCDDRCNVILSDGHTLDRGNPGGCTLDFGWLSPGQGRTMYIYHDSVGYFPKCKNCPHMDGCPAATRADNGEITLIGAQWPPFSISTGSETFYVWSYKY